MKIYLLAALGALLLAAWGGGYWHGSSSTASEYEAEKDKARTDGIVDYALQMQRATDASLANQGVSLELNTTLHVTRMRTREIVKEVNADVDAHPDLLACLLPDATRRQRDEQVASSAAIAAENRPVQ